MRSLLATVLLLPILAACQMPPKTAGPEAKPAEDSAVEMTMQQYWFGMIYRGPNYFDEVAAEDSQALQAAHLARIGELADSGEMALAGPFQDEREIDDPFIGLFYTTSRLGKRQRHSRPVTQLWLPAVCAWKSSLGTAFPASHILATPRPEQSFRTLYST